MNLWLDDVRDPAMHGRIGWLWIKTADEAIDLFKTGTVVSASLDHDLGLASCRDCRMKAYGETGLESALLIQNFGCGHGEKTGYAVVCWLEQNPEFWPKNKISVHSANPAGKARMQQVIDRHYGI